MKALLVEQGLSAFGRALVYAKIFDEACTRHDLFGSDLQLVADDIDQFLPDVFL